MSWEHTILASIDDRSKEVVVDVGPSKESHKDSSTDETAEELGYMNFDHEVSFSDLTEDEIVRSLIEDQNDMHADRLSREISYFMDNYSGDSTMDTVDPSQQRETTDNAGIWQNRIYDNEEISDSGYKGILFEFNH